MFLSILHPLPESWTWTLENLLFFLCETNSSRIRLSLRSRVFFWAYREFLAPLPTHNSYVKLKFRSTTGSLDHHASLQFFASFIEGKCRCTCHSIFYKNNDCRNGTLNRPNHSWTSLLGRGVGSESRQTVYCHRLSFGLRRQSYLLLQVFPTLFFSSCIKLRQLRTRAYLGRRQYPVQLSHSGLPKKFSSLIYLLFYLLPRFGRLLPPRDWQWVSCPWR